jgi:hypothetical protein
MLGLDQLQPGYYGHARGGGDLNPTRGALLWWGGNAFCSTVTGWFAVDAVTYSNGTVSALDLRFEQHCEGAAPALHGQIHYAAP